MDRLCVDCGHALPGMHFNDCSSRRQKRPPAHEHGAWIPVESIYERRGGADGTGAWLRTTLQNAERTRVTTLRCGVGECGYEVTRG